MSNLLAEEFWPKLQFMALVSAITHYIPRHMTHRTRQKIVTWENKVEAHIVERMPEKFSPYIRLIFEYMKREVKEWIKINRSEPIISRVFGTIDQTKMLLRRHLTANEFKTIMNAPAMDLEEYAPLLWGKMYNTDAPIPEEQYVAKFRLSVNNGHVFAVKYLYKKMQDFDRQQSIIYLLNINARSNRMIPWTPSMHGEVLYYALGLLTGNELTDFFTTYKWQLLFYLTEYWPGHDNLKLVISKLNWSNINYLEYMYFCKGLINATHYHSLLFTHNDIIVQLSTTIRTKNEFIIIELNKYREVKNIKNIKRIVQSQLFLANRLVIATSVYAINLYVEVLLNEGSNRLKNFFNLCTLTSSEKDIIREKVTNIKDTIEQYIDLTQINGREQMENFFDYADLSREEKQAIRNMLEEHASRKNFFRVMGLFTTIFFISGFIAVAYKRM